MAGIKVTTLPRDQCIRVEEEWVLRFCEWLLKHQWGFTVRHTVRNEYSICFSATIDMRKELPAHLRGKFATVH